MDPGLEARSSGDLGDSFFPKRPLVDDMIPEAVDLMAEAGDTDGTKPCLNFVAEMTRNV